MGLLLHAIACPGHWASKGYLHVRGSDSRVLGFRGEAWRKKKKPQQLWVEGFSCSSSSSSIRLYILGCLFGSAAASSSWLILVGDDCWVLVLPYFLSRNNTFKATAYGKGMVSSEMDTVRILFVSMFSVVLIIGMGSSTPLLLLLQIRPDCVMLIYIYLSKIRQF